MIATEFLHDIADYVDDRIAKVVLNDSYEITEFVVKAVTDNVVALNYIVPADEVSLVTLIELKDGEDNLITTNDVNVPIMSDTMILQTIETKEVIV